MSTDQNQSQSPFHLKNTNYDPTNFFVFLAAVLVSVIVLVGSVSLLANNLDRYLYYSWVPVVALVLAVYFLGWAYTEYNARYDYLKISRGGVEYHSSPKFMLFGWLPQKGYIPFGDIKVARVIQVQTGLDMLEQKQKQARFDVNAFVQKQLLLELELVGGKVLRIGERLPSQGILQCAVLVEGGAMLGQGFRKIAEKFPNLYSTASSVVKSLSGLFGQRKQSEE